jgi:hypothetical protein
MCNSTASSTVSLALTPIGSVMFALDTCPERSPNATGIRKSSTTRSDHFFQRVILIGTLPAIEHFTEDHAAHIFQLAGLFQLHQHAVDLKGFGSPRLR